MDDAAAARAATDKEAMAALVAERFAQYRAERNATTEIELKRVHMHAKSDVEREVFFRNDAIRRREEAEREAARLAAEEKRKQDRVAARRAALDAARARMRDIRTQMLTRMRKEAWIEKGNHLLIPPPPQPDLRTDADKAAEDEAFVDATKSLDERWAALWERHRQGHGLLLPALGGGNELQQQRTDASHIEWKREWDNWKHK